MERGSLSQLSRTVAALQDEVGRKEAALLQLRRQIRVNAVEADAARDPAQFRGTVLATRPGLRAVAALAGFLLGTIAGILLIT